MNRVLILFFLIASINLCAQTGIGTTTPHASAKLEVASDRQGFLPPRVTLSNVTDATTIPTPATGLLVYNLGSVGLQAGYYYWNGANWATIATGTTSGNAVVAMDMVKLYGDFYSTAPNKIAHSNGYSFNVPVSGRYLFDFSSSGYVNQTSFTFTFSVRQGTTVLASDFQTSANNNVHVEYNGKLEVNLQSGTTYNVYVNSTGSRDNGDFDRVYYKMVAGNLPVNQHMAERNLQLNNNFISNDGGNEGIRIDNAGNVGIGTNTPSVPLDINGAVNASTLSLTNSATGVSSLILRNGDAAATFSDNPQIRMGWAGSTAGASQFAQIIHTRHNSGPTNNAIDFYLSNGTANNTITSGSTRAMSITSPGNVEITGKLDVGDPTGNVATKASGIVDAGVDVTLGNLKVRMANSGNRSLQVSTISGSYSVVGSGTYSNGGSVVGTTINLGNPRIINTTLAYLNPNYNFGLDGATDTWVIMDITNNIGWRITLIVGASYFKNFISIERLL
jgi:hypothetical protein